MWTTLFPPAMRHRGEPPLSTLAEPRHSEEGDTSFPLPVPFSPSMSPSPSPSLPHEEAHRHITLITPITLITLININSYFTNDPLTL